MSRTHRPEILAPAGDWETLHAAVANGADAVYFGLHELNARLRAPNFSIDELPEVVRTLHDRNVRAYVTLNTLVFSEELPRAAALLAAIARSGADAAIVQDLGLAALAQRLVPSLPLHASTQMTLAEPLGIALARKLGIRRAILARELPASAIARVAETASLALEVFIHGALCISVSGQCFASLALGGRSANRGVCAQACRLPYRLVIDGTARNATGGPYVLSPRDLAAHDRVATLLRAGVAGFKIEGRLKGPAYVAAATRACREALDAAIDGRPFTLPPDRVAELHQGFSRGFTHGFLDGPDHHGLVDPRTPKHRGILAGTVVGKTPEGLLVKPRAGGDLKPGDGLLIEWGGPTAATQGGRVFEVRPPRNAPRPPPRSPRLPATGPAHRRNSPPTRAPADATSGALEIRFGRAAVDPDSIPVGSRVWKTDDPAVRRRLEKTFSRDVIHHRVPIVARVAARLGEPLRVTLIDGTGRMVVVQGDRPLEKAERHPLTIDLIREQLGRLGDTPFELGDVAADPLDPVRVPRSALNDLRRRAAAELLARRRETEARLVAEPEALETLRTEAASHRATNPPPAPLLHVLVRSAEQLDAVLAWTPEKPLRRPATIWCDLPGPGAARSALARARSSGLSAGLVTPRVLLPGEEGLLRAVLDANPDAVLTRSLGAIAFFQERARGLPLVADASLNAVNELAVAPLLAWGAARVAPGMDLDPKRLLNLAARVDPAILDLVVHRHAPMFHAVHCLYAANLGGGRDCARCDRPCDRHRLALEDRKGVRHPVAVDAAGRNTVFHGAAISGAEDLPGLLAAGIRHVRIELLDESGPATCAILDAYGALLAGRIDGKTAWNRLRKAAPGGLLRAMTSPPPHATPDFSMPH